MKQQTCKYISDDGAACLSLYHSKMYHKPKAPIKRTAIKKPTAKPFQLEKPKPRKKARSRSQLVKDLDKVFSTYIRISKSENGIATCITCGDKKPWKEMQNGHFYTRGRYPTRWDEDNCHVQDYRCNVLFKGNYINYTKYMIDRYGRLFVDELEFKSLNGEKIPTPVMREMIADYKQKVAELS